MPVIQLVTRVFFIFFPSIFIMDQIAMEIPVLNEYCGAQ